MNVRVPNRQALRAAGVGALLVGLFLALFEPYDRERTVRPSGDTRSNPHLAVQRFIAEMGVAVTSVPALVRMPELDAGQAVVWLAPSNPQTLLPKNTKAWVDGGGHLLWGPPRSALGTNAPQWLAEGLTVLHDADAGGDFVQLGVGEGWLTGLGGTDDFTNSAFVSGNTPSQLWRALTIDGVPSNVILVVWPRSTSLWSLLLEHWWPALVSLLLLICVWLWTASSRIGPRRTVLAPNRRSLVEHVQATGLLLWRTNSAGAMVAASRRRLRSRLDTRFPAIATLAEREWLAALAEQSEQPEAVLRAAMVSPCQDKSALIETMRAQRALEEY